MFTLRFQRNILAALALASCIAVPMTAQSPPDLSGTYTGKSSDQKSSSSELLVIAQTASQIEITLTENGKVKPHTFQLDGSSSPYRTSVGAEGQASAHWKGSTLVVETLVAAPPQNGKIIHFHTTEQWQLSKDKQNLKVRTDVDSPDMPREITSAAFQAFTVTYRRSQGVP